MAARVFPSVDNPAAAAALCPAQASHSAAGILARLVAIRITISSSGIGTGSGGCVDCGKGACGRAGRLRETEVECRTPGRRWRQPREAKPVAIVNGAARPEVPDALRKSGHIGVTGRDIRAD